MCLVLEEFLRDGSGKLDFRLFYERFSYLTFHGGGGFGKSRTKAKVAIKVPQFSIQM